jgi:iron uptake system EfeUOB component EfeO/EfeM
LDGAPIVHSVAVSSEPGLDRHELESQWSQLEEDVRTSPEEALPEMADLIESVLGEAGYDLADPVAREGEEREVVAEFQAARDIADMVDRGDDVDPGDLASAINGLTALYEYLSNTDAREL